MARRASIRLAHVRSTTSALELVRDKTFAMSATGSEIVGEWLRYEKASGFVTRVKHADRL